MALAMVKHTPGADATSTNSDTNIAVPQGFLGKSFDLEQLSCCISRGLWSRPRRTWPLTAGPRAWGKGSY